MPVGAAELGWRRVLWLTCALALVFMVPDAISSVPARAQSAGDTSTLLALINQDRASAGDSPVSLNSALSAIAQSWAAHMAAATRISQNPAFPGDVPAANALGENVGCGPTATAVHNAFVASPPHQAVMIDRSYRVVGIGTAPSAVGLMVVEDFADTAGSAVAPPATHAAPPPAPATAAPVKPQVVTVSPKPAATHAQPASPAPPPPPPPPPPAPPPPPPSPAPPMIDVALYSRMLQWEQWQAVTGLGS